MDKNLKYYDDKFYKQHEAWTSDYRAVSKWIHKNIEGNIFGDVGCGNGYMISNLHKMGKKVWGVDAAENFEDYVDKSVRRYVKKVDLTQSSKLDKGDVALCFEVAEHIDKKYADKLVSNIVSTNAHTILFTAAKPGQEGTHHINLQPKTYWLDKFAKHGYCLDAGLSEKFKADLAKNIETTVWYLENIMVLQKCSDKHMRASFDATAEVIANLQASVSKTEAQKDKAEQDASKAEAKLHKILNSKRWKASSKLIRLVKR